LPNPDKPATAIPYNHALSSLSIVIPAFNEERRLPATLDSILEWFDTQRLSFAEIVVVDDGSSDQTAALVLDYEKKDARVRLLRNLGNRGKGYSVRHGVLEAQGEWILTTDADLSTPIEDVSKLFAAAREYQAAIAIGSRAIDRSLVLVHQSGFREYSGRIFNWVMRQITGLPFRDTQCGFKLFSAGAARQIFPRQQLDGFSFDVEDLYIARKQNLAVVEIAVRWKNAEGTKVTLSQGIRSFLDLAKIRGFDLSGKYR
jgi:glycosyltransferase involved in cell wall biosynthesis